MGSSGWTAPLWGDQERTLTRHQRQPGDCPPRAQPGAEGPGGAGSHRANRIPGRSSKGRVHPDCCRSQSAAHHWADGSVGHAVLAPCPCSSDGRRVSCEYPYSTLDEPAKIARILAALLYEREKHGL